uniref:Putative secreted protein n=1 Tax=Anopheles marajoara TaxID=58244 RepID=A0A2M4CFI7_9DIPT
MRRWMRTGWMVGLLLPCSRGAQRNSARTSQRISLVGRSFFTPSALPVRSSGVSRSKIMREIQPRVL